MRAGKINRHLGSHMLDFSPPPQTAVAARDGHPALQVQALTKSSSVAGIPGFGGRDVPRIRVSPNARYALVPNAGLRGKSYRASREITGLGGKRCRARGEEIPGFGGNFTGLRGKFLGHNSCKTALFSNAAPPTV